MSIKGWMINLSGKSIPVYLTDVLPEKRIGTLTKNECFADDLPIDVGYEGWGTPVTFLNASQEMDFGMIESEIENLVDFCDYASTGTSWVSVNTLKRKVQYATVAYYSDGSKCCSFPAGSYVWLDPDCTHGQNNPNYISVTKVQTAAGKTYEFDENGFIGLTYGGRWVNVGSILLRKA